MGSWAFRGNTAKDCFLKFDPRTPDGRRGSKNIPTQRYSNRISTLVQKVI
jgi:hypothetical protein